MKVRDVFTCIDKSSALNCFQINHVGKVSYLREKSNEEDGLNTMLFLQREVHILSRNDAE